MIARNFEPGAPIRNFLKDLNTVLETAGNLNIRLPIVEAVKDVYQELNDKGFERQDHSAFLLHLEELNTPVPPKPYSHFCSSLSSATIDIGSLPEIWLFHFNNVTTRDTFDCGG